MKALRRIIFYQSSFLKLMHNSPSASGRFHGAIIYLLCSTKRGEWIIISFAAEALTICYVTKPEIQASYEK